MKATLVQRLQAMRATHWLWRECLNRETHEVVLVPLWRRIPSGFSPLKLRW